MNFTKCILCLILIFSSKLWAAPVEERYLKQSDGHILFDGNLKLHEIAITFGGSLNPKVIPTLLKILAENNLRAHFFIPGDSAAKNMDLVKAIYKAGHIVASNGTGRALMKKNDNEDQPIQVQNQLIEEEIRTGHEVIYATLGTIDPFVRFSYRHDTGAARQMVKDFNVFAFYWNIDYDSEAPAETLSASLKKENYRGIVALGSYEPQSITALKRLVEEIKNNDLKVIAFRPPQNIDWKRNVPLIRQEILKEVIKRGPMIYRRDLSI